MMITTQADHTKWKKLGVLSPFMYFTMSENYKQDFPVYTFHYECVDGDLDECDFTYVEINDVPVILQKYLNLEKHWSAQVDIKYQTKEFNQKLIEALAKEFAIREITWQRFDGSLVQYD